MRQQIQREEPHQRPIRSGLDREKTRTVGEFHAKEVRDFQRSSRSGMTNVRRARSDASVSVR